MKRLSSTDSLGGLIADEHCRRSDNNLVYSREFQTMLDGLDEEGCHVAEKKRRLSVDQVKALEKNFDVENKLEPERKVTLAQELGLQPRQVAVWFQNRRARWKTKQLERDYGVLKASFDSLKHNYDSLKLDHDSLVKEIRDLKSKIGDEENEKAESFDLSVKEDEEEDIMVPETEQIGDDHQKPGPTPAIFGSSQVNKDWNFTDNLNNVFPDFKEGSSDSDSSAILNDEYYNATGSPTKAAIFTSPPSSPAPSGFQFQAQFVKLEEHNFFTGDEACDFFSDEQPPSLQQLWQNS